MNFHNRSNNINTVLTISIFVLAFIEGVYLVVDHYPKSKPTTSTIVNGNANANNSSNTQTNTAETHIQTHQTKRKKQGGN
jgi:hypothetical protein